MTEDMMFTLILPTLPVKSLIRFQLVRKLWHSVINSHWFVENHLSYSMHNNSSTCILFKHPIQTTGQKELGFSLIHLRHHNADDDDGEKGDTNNIKCIVEDVKFPLSSDIESLGIRAHGNGIESLGIRGHCNGILCLTIYERNDILLCNPAINALKILPKSCILDDEAGYAVGVGIGCDPETKDYTVVRIAGYGAEVMVNDDESIDDGMAFLPPRVEIFAFGTNSWREIEKANLETETSFFWPDNFQMCLNGTWYWLGYEQPKEFWSSYDTLSDDHKTQMMFLFDTTDEVFRDVLFPSVLYEKYSDRGIHVHITLWNESVALFGLSSGGYIDTPEEYGLWVLGEGSRWTKHLTIEALVGINTEMVQFWKSDEILMVNSAREIFYYNVETERLKNLPVDCDRRDPYYIQTSVYVHSLVSVTRGNNRLEIVDI